MSLATLALLEVMDKVPPVSFVWLSAVAVAGTGFVIALLGRWWALLLWVPAMLIASEIAVGSLLEADLAPLIRRQAPPSYVVWCWAALLVIWITPLAGLALRAGGSRARRPA